MRAKLRVPSGAPDHDRGGETSSASQVKRAGIGPPALNADDVSWKVIV
jgi:hypothetical protein